MSFNQKKNIVHNLLKDHDLLSAASTFWFLTTIFNLIQTRKHAVHEHSPASMKSAMFNYWTHESNL